MNRKKIYIAIVYDEKKRCFSKRVSIEASGAEEAKRIMDSTYGVGKYINLHNEVDANRSR